MSVELTSLKIMLEIVVLLIIVIQQSLDLFSTSLNINTLRDLILTWYLIRNKQINLETIYKLTVKVHFRSLLLIAFNLLA
jgi:hypothetical protein